MRVLKFLSLVVLFGASQLAAQTNNAALPQTAVAAPGPGDGPQYTGRTTGSLVNQTNNVRLLTLLNCIELALEHNLTLKIERLNPTIAQLDLEIAKAGYDPVLASAAPISSR